MGSTLFITLFMTWDDGSRQASQRRHLGPKVLIDDSDGTVRR